MRNDNCTTCGGFGYTINTNHTMTGCAECSVAAQEADSHEYEGSAHRCTHCNQLHPSLRLSPTGRIIADPPFQNIPVRTELGRKIRKLVLSKGSTRIDVRSEPPRGVAYTFGGLS